MKKVVQVIRYPDCIMDEVAPTIEMLSSLTDLKIVDLASLDPRSDVDLLVVPGGSCDLAITDEKLRQLIRHTSESGRLVAGICNGALVLASAGILRGRRCTHTAQPKYAPVPQFQELLDVAVIMFKDAIYVDEDVVTDGNIITAKPWAAVEFAKAIKADLVGLQRY